ncbi:MAG: MBL fold metallo-hydrolase, partial [Lachnospiraceae bacterium]|nr:MBL fold metallo-hydrolase [Lachnospiraceae bacterium]
MKITFIGADHEVTGSCHYLEAAGKKILIDYGMEQGQDTFENVPLPVSAGEIDYVFLTHAHIDHSGLLPLLGKNGFSGKIYATRATCDLCGIMLLDSAHIQEFEAEWRNRKGKRKGLEPYVPLYVTEDAERIAKHFVGCPYGSILDIADGIKIRFTDVGHLLGSATVEVWVTEDGKETK